MLGSYVAPATAPAAHVASNVIKQEAAVVVDGNVGSLLGYAAPVLNGNGTALPADLDKVAILDAGSQFGKVRFAAEYGNTVWRGLKGKARVDFRYDL